SLERIAAHSYFADDSAGGSFAFRQLMFLWIESVARICEHGDQADATGGIATGGLKLAELSNEIFLPGTFGGFVERENMVENEHQHMQPFSFGAAQLFHFETQRGFLAIVGFLHELREFLHF